MPRTACLLIFAVLLPLSVSAADGPATAESVAQEKATLGPLQELVGTWRGVGQPQRGSTRGAWIEQAEWQWQFDDWGAALAFEAPQAKYFRSGRIVTVGEDGSRFQLIATVPDREDPVTYSGSLADDQLSLDADEVIDGLPARVTVRTVADGKRLVVLYESRLGDSDRYLRLAEVGYTRRGSGFGGGITYTECVVTGGYADRSVEYMGKTYPICCEGCRNLFLMDPEGVLAEYRERLAERRENTD